MSAPSWAMNAAIVVVLAGWIGTLIVSAVDRSYEPPPGVEPLMMALAAFLFASKHKDKSSEQSTEVEEQS